MHEWIINYIRKHGPVSATDELFHEAFYQNFGGARKETMFGAQPVAKAMQMLKQMYNDGHLDRAIIGLGGMPVGYPKWNYVYYIERVRGR